MEGSYNESRFNISAWEYEAPTTSLDSGAGLFGEESRRLFEGRLRQNGEADLPQVVSIFQARSNSGQIGLAEPTYSDLSAFWQTVSKIQIAQALTDLESSYKGSY
jgi:hypothetical protein